jgi:hypothetical protein
LLRGSWQPTSFRAAILEQLGTLRAAAYGDSLVEIPIFCGFVGARVSSTFDSGGAVARPYVGGLQDTVFDSADRLGNDARFVHSGFVLELPHRWKFAYLDEPPRSRIVAGDALASDDPSEAEEFGRIREWASCLAIAVASPQVGRRLRPHVLATEAPLEPVPELICVYNADPLDGSRSFHFSRPWPHVDSATTQLERSHLERARELAGIGDGSVRVAIRRINASLVRPRLWEDALLDAVIGWEALAGERGAAVKMMTSAVIARLVADEGVEDQVRAKVQKIYETRNPVVHGAEVKDSARVRVAADAATRVAIVALNALVDERKDLLGVTNRVERLFLRRDHQ